MVGYMLQCQAWFIFLNFISCCYVIVITIITVITFDDEIRELPNPDEKRRRLKEAAREVTGSETRDVFLIANSIPDQEFDPAYKKEVLKMLEQALKCGERSIKMRQVQRESPKRSISKPQGRAEKSAVENTEEPNYKSWSGWLYDQVSSVRSVHPRINLLNVIVVYFFWLSNYCSYSYVVESTVLYIDFWDQALSVTAAILV